MTSNAPIITTINNMDQQECVVCTRQAWLFCENCAEIQDTGRPLNARWYCTALCRESDRPGHAPNCFSQADHEQILHSAHRAGELAQTLFYVFIEHTWAYDISNLLAISDQHGQISALDVVHGPGHEAGPGGESTCEQRAGGWLTNFPQDAFKAADRKAKHTLLADQHSVWAFIFMHSVVQAVFEGLINDADKDIKEAVHYLPAHVRRLIRHKDQPRMIRHKDQPRMIEGKYDDEPYLENSRDDLPYPDKDKNGDLKGVYRITLKDGNIIALDLAGAQYSLPHETVMSWSAYLERCASKLKYRIPFRSHYHKHMEHMSEYRFITHLTVVMEQATCLAIMLRTSTFTLGIDLKDLAGEDIEIFRQCRDNLELAVKNALQQRPDELDGDGDDTRCIVQMFDLRHPKIIDDIEKAAAGESVFFDFGDMKKFDWSKFSDMIKLPGSLVARHERKTAEYMMQYRCVYKMPGDWRLRFLESSLPPAHVPEECISENPYWLK